jgi:hypothetical protein
VAWALGETVGAYGAGVGLDGIGVPWTMATVTAPLIVSTAAVATITGWRAARFGVVACLPSTESD